MMQSGGSNQGKVLGRVAEMVEERGEMEESGLVEQASRRGGIFEWCYLGLI